MTTPVTRLRSALLIGALAGSVLLAGCSAAFESTPGESGARRTGPTDQAVIVAGGDPAPPASAAQRARPNIVMVMADDMRVDDLEFAPNVRKLIGGNGLTFENSFSPFPLCCPARASFLSGQYAHNHGVYWHEEPYGYAAFDDSRTIATSLRAAGYQTGFVGKYLNGYGPMKSKVSGGPSWKYVPEGWSDWVGAFEDPGVKGIHGGTYNYFDTPYNVNGEVDNRYRGRYQTDVVGDFSVELARKYRRSANPFFLYVSYVAPHYGAPVERDDTQFVTDDEGKRREFATPARPGWVRGRFDKVITRGSGMPRTGGPAEADVSDKPARLAARPEVNAAERRALTKLTRQRAEAVYVLDRQVGRLVRELKQSGEWADTVFMFTSDNGYLLGEHRMRVGKVWPHEPSLRVPYLVTGPGVRSPERRYEPITTVDITATILDIAHAAAPHLADGTSKWATMRDGDRAWTAPVVTEAVSTAADRHVDGFPRSEPRSSIGLRTARYSFTRYRNGSGELYDLAVDPNQLENLYSSRYHRAVRRELTDQWYRYKNCAGADCREPLPDSMRATVPENRALGGSFWAEVDRVYGRR
jgi:N-acetylglucosamine-6-sulfatase